MGYQILKCMYVLMRAIPDIEMYPCYNERSSGPSFCVDNWRGQTSEGCPRRWLIASLEVCVWCLYFGRQVPDGWRPQLYVSAHETTRHMKDSTDRHTSGYICSLTLPTDSASIDGSSLADVGIEYCGLACCVVTQHVHPQYSIDCSSIEHLSEGNRNAPWRWQCYAQNM
jgi:hypothetical protein